MPQTQTPGSNPRKRRSSPEQSSTAAMTTNAPGDDPVPPAPDATPRKKGRTNTPWTAEEEQRLKAMRDAGRSWNEIAKTFPNRTEGSVKKHWYKDMHYAEFAENESVALREAIKEYEANKWKVIGQKVGKPAKVSYRGPVQRSSS
ncbi:SANT/Myb-like DNA-binding domain-containing protein [Aspergillus lucknowensis]|uniref:Myb-like transcription factor n=1 Tax=Aspergillus lucknowensis TaxID=176173 RepID=A0ABR4LU29_9EURO